LERLHFKLRLESALRGEDADLAKLLSDLADEAAHALETLRRRSGESSP
jgi:hypothetical protein